MDFKQHILSTLLKLEFDEACRNLKTPPTAIEQIASMRKELCEFCKPFVVVTDDQNVSGKKWFTAQVNIGDGRQTYAFAFTNEPIEDAVAVLNLFDAKLGKTPNEADAQLFLAGILAGRFLYSR